jgi:light-independent protochlorophyllide reductase subunit B
MKLAYWMYAGPAHIGTLRVASSFKNVHAIMHAPLGDDYFNVLRSMLERERDFTPVTASIVDRHVLARGSQEKVVENITRKHKEESPDLVLLTPTCTSSILQEDLHNFVERSTIALTSTNTDSGINQSTSLTDVILADVNHYRVNELQAADRTLAQIVRFYIEKAKKQKNLNATKTTKPSVNIIGIFTLGFHNQHDCRELKRLFNDLGITINEIIPEGGCVHNLKNLPKAWFNFVPYREVGLMAAVYLKTEFNMPYVSTTPMGLVDTSLCIREIGSIIESMCLVLDDNQNNSSSVTKAATSTNLTASFQPKDFVKNANDSPSTNSSSLSTPWNSFAGTTSNALGWNKNSILPQYLNYIDQQTRFVSQAAWFARSIDCQNLTGKKAVVFGDATHAAAMTKILSREMGIRVSCAGTYCKHDADWFREQVAGFCDQVLITDDHTQVGDMIALLEPAAIFGTQMERHVGKRLDIPCGVISAPVHIQNFPLGYRPFLGYEGANQIADLVYNSFSLGMEEHLLQIFGGHDVARPGSNKIEQVNGDQEQKNNNQLTANNPPINSIKNVAVNDSTMEAEITWSDDGLAELRKVPGFVRGKVKRNTEKYASQNQINVITVEIMYAAKEAMSPA